VCIYSCCINLLDIILSLVNDENIIEKTEKLKVNNINKCILWCDKYKIQCKHNEKVNIFTCETLI
jgi:hypothetical protein